MNEVRAAFERLEERVAKLESLVAQQQQKISKLEHNQRHAVACAPHPSGTISPTLAERSDERELSASMRELTTVIEQRLRASETYGPGVASELAPEPEACLTPPSPSFTPSAGSPSATYTTHEEDHVRPSPLGASSTSAIPVANGSRRTQALQSPAVPADGCVSQALGADSTCPGTELAGEWKGIGRRGP